jgi:Xaa-Pro dipeptidase
MAEYKTSSPKAKEWESWPTELPTAARVVKESQSPEMRLFYDAQFNASLHKENRENTLKLVRADKHFQQSHKGALFFMGGTSLDWALYDSDCHKAAFRQEAFFKYLFGLNEPDCFGMIDLTTGESTLFIPYVEDAWVRWNGPRRALEWYRDTYDVDRVQLTRDLDTVLTERDIKTLHILAGINSDSDSAVATTPKFAGLDKYENKTDKRAIDNSSNLYNLLAKQRVYKTDKEVVLMRAAVRVTSQAHVYVMRHMKAGLREIQTEALFKAWTGYFAGSRHVAYDCICAAGCNGATLHYGHAGRPNDRILQDGEMMVLDMGAEYNGYATDITRAYPVNGKFTKEQREVYDAVRASQVAVLDSMKPGVLWSDMHRLAEKVILQHLLKMGLVKGTLEELIAANIATVFMPHGLGHFLGLHVHDVGGYVEAVRSAEPGLQWLRTSKRLEKGMVITVEPGLYFNQDWFAAAKLDATKRDLVHWDKVMSEPYLNFGGVRLEDDVLVTETGIENFTILPSTSSEIEEVIQTAQNRSQENEKPSTLLLGVGALAVAVAAVAVWAFGKSNKGK